MKTQFDDPFPCTTVVETVAAVIRDSPRDLSPLAETIHPDAITGVVDSPKDDPTLTFEYEGAEVTVTPDAVEVQPVGPTGSP